MLKRLLAFALFSCAAWAQAQLVPIPPLTGLVTDLTNTLTLEQKNDLEAFARQYADKKGTQIGVLIVPTTQPETIEAFSIRVVDQWKLGRKKIDDGVLLLVAKDDRRVRIEVGTGLEGVLTDFASNSIIRQDITPRFKEGDFAGGVAAGVQAIMMKIDPEGLPPPPDSLQNQSSQKQSLSNQLAQGNAPSGLVAVFVFFLFAIHFGSHFILGRLFGSIVTGAYVGIVTWFVVSSLFIGLIFGVVMMFLSLLSMGTGFLPIGGRYIDRGGWSGGGFGGGGGGGFSGGGSSGSW